MTQAMQRIVDLINKGFEAAQTAEEYRGVLRRAKRLPRKAQLAIVDELRFAAHRLGLDEVTGTPKVSVLDGGARKVAPRGEIVKDGKIVIVEELN